MTYKNKDSGDCCFPRGLCRAFCCMSFCLFVLRECFRGSKLLSSKSFKSAFFGGIGLEEKTSVLPRLIFHGALLCGKIGCHSNCCIIHLCRQDSPDCSPAQQCWLSHVLPPLPIWLWLASMLVSPSGM